jgi:Phosphotransferase enzyme family
MSSFRRSKRLAADQVDAELLGRIANIGEESGNNCADAASSITFLRKTCSQHSQVSTYRIETPSGPKYVVAKRIRDPNPGTVDFLQREYDALQKISKVAGDSLADTFPNALLFSQKRIVLSMVAGVSLDGQLKRTANALTGWLSTRHMQETGRQVAAWLGRFHDLIRSGDIAHDHEKYATELDTLLLKCAPFGVSAPTLRGIREAGFRLSRALQSRFMAAAASHGDFIPQNILVHQGKLGVIDFASYSDRAPVYQDVAHFVGYILLLGAKPIYAEKPLRVLASSFLAGYPFPLDSALLRIFLIKALLRLISDGKPVPNYLSRIRSGNLDNLLLRLTDDQKPLPFGIQL